MRKALLYFLSVMLILAQIDVPIVSVPLPLRQILESANPLKVDPALARGQYGPSGGSLVVGTEAAITAGATSGNVGSWKGTLAQDATSPGFNWTVNTNASTGLDQELNIDQVSLMGANMMDIVIRANAGSASLNRFYQICDWVSTTNVDNAADSNCTGGGWRTLNVRKVAIASASITNYTWSVYDGYWTTDTTSNTTVSTPLANFVTTDSNKRVLLRAYSTTALSTTHLFDFVNISTFINPIYYPAGFTQISGGSVTTSYINTTNGTQTGQSGSDNVYLSVPGTAGAIADFYLSFTNVQTYTGMNTIVVKAEYSCSTTGINIKPKIYNFNTASWEDLTATTIACSATDATNEFAVNNITISNYVSAGEIRVGFYGSGNNVLSLRVDHIYIMVGSTNTDSSLCEISFGTGTASNCSNARNMDTTLASPTTWSPTTELESTSFSHTYYGLDNDGDATSGEAAWAVNSTFSVTMPSGAAVTRLGYGIRWRATQSTAITTQAQFKDYSGANATISGGWTLLGTTNNSATYTYEDPILNGWFTTNPNDYIDTYNNQMKVRIRTTASTITSNVTGDVDFLFVTMSWVVSSPVHASGRNQYVATGGNLAVGTEGTITSGATSGNVGSWKGTLAQDATSPGFNWTVTSNSSTGLNQQVLMDGVQLHNANTFEIVIRASAGATSLSRVYQICDWVSTTSVDTAADANCTGGGWRTLNIRKTALTATAVTNYTWHIYDGYWTTSVSGNTTVSTPLSNFISSDSNSRVLIRAYSTSAVAVTHTLDLVSLRVIIDPVYMASGFSQIAGGTPTGSYANTVNAALTGQSASDNNRINVPGTASAISDFYLAFGNIRTYDGMNSILVRAEYGCSAAGGLNFRPKIYNFTSTAWEDLSSNIACSTTDATNQFVKNNITIGDYVSNGEVRVGFYTTANSTTNVRIDLIYLILGTTNTDSSLCEIDFGSGTATNCTNTRDMDSTLASPNTWQPTTELESTNFGHSYYALANDADATSNEAAWSVNNTFSMVTPENGYATRLGYAVRWRSSSAVTTVTTQAQYKDRSGLNATVSGGWTALGTTNAATTYTYEDPITNSYFGNSADDYVNVVAGTTNMRLRTSASTATSNTTGDIDFMMATLAWIEVTPEQTLTFSLSDNSVGFGTLTSANARYATGDTSGTTSETEAHTISAATNASNGYILTVQGATLTSGQNTVAAIGGSNTASSPGGAQFGLRLTASGGSGTVSSPYAASGFAYAATASTASQIASASGSSDTTTYSVRYLANIAGDTPSGSYSTTLTYILVTNY